MSNRAASILVVLALAATGRATAGEMSAALLDNLRASSAGRPADPGLFGDGGKEVRPRAVSAEEQGQLIDKPKIAEETMRRIEGTREGGSRAGGPLLSTIEEDPEHRQVDAEELRADLIRQIEGNIVLDTAKRPAPPDPEEALKEAAPALKEEAATSKVLLAVCGGALLAGAVAAFLLGKRS
jgi:hypothetical protein